MTEIKKNRLNEKGTVFAGIVVVLLVWIGFYGPGSGGSQVPIGSEAIKAYAENVVAACSGENYRPGCYDKEILKLHGGFQEKFETESFTDDQIAEMKLDLADICEERAGWKPSWTEEESCYHALGKLSMHLTGGDVNKSISLCGEISLKKNGEDLRALCFNGVFMQIFQPLEPEDFALVYGKQPTKEEIPGFCGKFDGNRKASCLRESWPLFSEEIMEPQGLVEFCSKNDSDDHIDSCYYNLFYVLAAKFNFDSPKIIEFCPRLPKMIGFCFANAARRSIETDFNNIGKAAALCSSASQFDKEDICFRELVFYSATDLVPGSEKSSALCRALPSPWNKKCSDKSAAYR